jgi:hypothetical protein
MRNNVANTTLAGPTETAAGLPVIAAAAADTASIAKTIIHPSIFTPQGKRTVASKAQMNLSPFSLRVELRSVVAA